MDPQSLAALFGGGLSYLTNNDPYSAAMPFYDQIPGTASPYYQPYINAGLQSLGTLQNQYNQLLTNPDAIMQMLGGGFQQSPGYQFQYDQAMNGVNNAAAAGGMLGSSAHQQQAANMSGNIANQDYYNYLGNTMGLYNQGLSGMQGLNTMGYNASDTLAQLLAGALASQGNLAAGSAAHNNSMDQSLIGMGTEFLGGLF